MDACHLLVSENIFDQTRADILEIKAVQNELLTQLLNQKEDIRILLTRTHSGSTNLRSTFPAHPAGSTEELNVLEAFVSVEDNYNNFVSPLCTIIKD